MDKVQVMNGVARMALRGRGALVIEDATLRVVRTRSHGFLRVILMLMLELTMSACSSDTTSWKEEVLLHDGSKIIVARSHTYGDRRGEIGQGRLIDRYDIDFTLPGSTEKIHWHSDYSLHLILLGHVNNSLFVVGIPVSCIDFNFWDRPNPPYVIFKYINHAWQRIRLDELPPEIKVANLLMPTKKLDSNYAKQLAAETSKYGFLSSATKNQWNKNTPEYSRILLRQPVTYGAANLAGNCGPKLIFRNIQWIMDTGDQHDN